MNQLLKNLIIDGLALFAFYSINFIACDLVYHNFNLQQSIKGAYWFILGPFLYIAGPAVKKLEFIIKEERKKLQNKIKGIWHKIDPFDLLLEPVDLLTESLLGDGKVLETQIQNFEYLKSINRI